MIDIKEPYYVYILECCDNSYYVGMTNNLRKRMIQHKHIDKYAAKYVKERRPVELVCVIDCENYHDALRTEIFVRSLSRDKKDELIEEWRVKNIVVV